MALPAVTDLVRFTTANWTRFIAVLCLALIVMLAAVQSVHFHLDRQSGSMDSHCTLCVVSHTVSRPQSTYVVALPVRFQPPSAVVEAPRQSQTAIFQLFVRPPPAV